MAPRKRFASVILALFSALLIVPTATFTDAATTTRISRQPVSFAQMQRLVIPDNPAVQEILRSLLGDARYNPAGIPRTVSDVTAINEWIKEIDYVSDEDAHGVNDYWQTPSETITLKTGDCEDIAILFVSLLRAYGVPEDEAFVAVGFDANDNWHAWVFEKCFMRVWREMDPESQSPASLLSAGVLPYEMAYCFNDRISFRGSPVEPTAGRAVLCANTNYPWSRGASSVFRRYLKAGERVKVAVEWLVTSPNAVAWADIYYPWSLGIYSENGANVASWSGTDNACTQDFVAEAAGTYYLEVLKRDSAARYCLLSVTPDGWEQEPAGGFSPQDNLIPDFNPVEFTAGVPDGLINPVKNPPPQELVDYTLELINREWITPVPLTSTQPPGGSSYSWGGFTPEPLILGAGSYAQSHAEDMLAKRYYAFWHSNGLMPALNNSLTGGYYFFHESTYFTRVNWSGSKDQRYLAYLKTLIDGAKTEIQRDSTGNAPEKRSIRAVNIGIAFDDEYLFLVLDYEYVPFIVFNQPPVVIHNSVITLSWSTTGGMIFSGMLQVYYFRMPRELTAGQLNSSGSAYPVGSFGNTAAYVYNSTSYFPYENNSFTYATYPVPEDPALIYTPSSSGLETRSAVLQGGSGATHSIPILRTYATSWLEDGGSDYVTVDLSQAVATFGPGVYTIRLYCFGPGWPSNYIGLSSSANFSLILE